MRSKNNYHRLHIQQPMAIGNDFLLEDAMQHYLQKVLRLKPGALFNVFNDIDGQFVAQLSQKGFCITAFCSAPSSMPYLHLGFCMVKNTVIAQIMDEATQLGVTHITPLISQYVNNREFNLPRYEKIVIEATQQSARFTLPQIFTPITLNQFIEQEFDLILFADEGQLHHTLQDFTQQLNSSNKIALIIGPEGGFNEQERHFLRSKASSICLGPYILRTQVACTALLSQISIMRRKN